MRKQASLASLAGAVVFLVFGASSTLADDDPLGYRARLGRSSQPRSNIGVQYGIPHARYNAGQYTQQYVPRTSPPLVQPQRVPTIVYPPIYGPGYNYYYPRYVPRYRKAAVAATPMPIRAQVVKVWKGEPASNPVRPAISAGCMSPYAMNPIIGTPQYPTSTQTRTASPTRSVDRADIRAT